MKLAFVDETGDVSRPEYLGLAVATVDARFYPLLKSKVQRILRAVQWDENVEFKGSYLFSRTKGCSDVEVEERVNAAREVLKLNVAEANRRVAFHYGSLDTKDHRGSYLAKLPGLLVKALGSAPGSGKNLVAVFVDERSDVTADQLQSAIAPALEKKGWVLVERVTRVRSSCATVGVMLVDIVAYLSSRIETLATDAQLFEGVPAEQLARTGSLRKLQSSTELIGHIKELKLHRM